MSSITKIHKETVAEAIEDDDGSSNSFASIDDDIQDDSSADGLSVSTGNFDANQIAAQKKQNADFERLNMAKKEDKAVKTIRLVAFLALVATAALVCTGVFLLARNDQAEDFENELDSHVTKLMESFQESVEGVLGAYDDLSQSITSHAKNTPDTSFPNVTLPDFEVRANAARVLSGSLFVYYTPLVDDDSRSGWESYSSQNFGHLMPAFMNEYALASYQDVKYSIDSDTSTSQEGQDSDQEGQSVENHSDRKLQEDFPGMIWGADGQPKAEGEGPYAPIWQISPALPLQNLLNFNNIDMPYFSGVYNNVIKTSKATFGAFTDLDQDDAAVEVLNAFIAASQYRHVLDEYENNEPITSMAFPVFDDFGPQRRVVGILCTAIYWRIILTNVLSPSAQGIIAVLENSQGQFETYRIDGPHATYLGPGDLHDPDFEDLSYSTDVTEFVNSRASPETRSYTAVDLNDQYISYTLHVYPSRVTEAKYVNNEPMIYSIVVGSVFLFTTLVFIVYDFLVEKRQNKVLKKAVQSTTLVKSLFPEKVHSRLYEEGDEEKKKADGKLSWQFSKDREEGSEDILEGGNALPTTAPKSRPIADLFPECTVFFADLAGFTSWSSKRTPIEVFELLEALYGAFDAIANQRNVFKVETIGDCYVAVTGLPNPQEDHAVLMVKFARSCLVKMNQIVQDLKETLGDDTADLQMRIGLHSGPVTAGVLRGEKSRFQLFGDTVNTASRMESNGVKGRIHCSKATAEQLVLAHKKSWLTPREELIEAKGKGTMQTYFVSTSSGAKTSRTSATSTSGYHHRRSHNRGSATSQDSSSYTSDESSSDTEPCSSEMFQINE